MSKTNQKTTNFERLIRIELVKERAVLSLSTEALETFLKIRIEEFAEFLTQPIEDYRVLSRSEVPPIIQRKIINLMAILETVYERY